jgi:hypothetical protein
MSGFTRRVRWAGVVGVVGAVALALAGSGLAGAASSAGKAEHGTVHFAVTHTVGKISTAAGDATDSLFGQGAVVYRIHILPAATGKVSIKIPKVTVFYSTGSASGTATATLTVTNKPKSGDATVTGGVLKLTKGTGTHQGHTFVGTFSGSGNVTSDAYTINYKGTYK